MKDFEMTCETLARKIFQCSRFNDPLGRLANTDSWSGLLREGFSKRHMCRAWAVLARLQNEYLDSVKGREVLYEQSTNLEQRILNATTNIELREIMIEISQIVEQLGLSESPHIDYKNTNDNNQ